MKRFLYTILSVSLWIGLSGCVDDPTMIPEVIGAGSPEFEGKTVIKAKTASSIMVSAKISAANGNKITQRGFIYGLDPQPTLENGNEIPDTEVGVGEYSLTIEGLVHNTRYYFRPYASNSLGTSYGEQVDTLTNVGIGGVFTLRPDSIRASAARVRGEIDNIGEGDIIAMGIYLSEKNNISVVDTIYSTSSPTEAKVGTIFTCQLSGLTPSTSYYVQAFVTNSYGETVGERDSLLTRDGMPLLSETNAKKLGFTDVTLTSYVSTGADETVIIVDRGFCWAIDTDSEYPTLSNNVIPCGTGSGAFEGIINSLVSKQRYYVRAYATSNFGFTVYDENVLIVVPLTDVPTVGTNAVTNIQNGNADVSGIIYGVGMSPVITSGICWSTTNVEPDLDDSVLPLLTGGNSFSGRLTQLRGGVTYYVRAFATNSQGTGYSEEVRQFTTPHVFTDGLRAFSGAAQFAMSYFAIDAYLYILGGDAGANYTDEIWRYSVANNTWTQGSSFIGSPAKWQTSVAYGQGALVYGGINANGDEKPGIFHYKAPPENNWTYYNGPPDSAIVYRTVGYSYSNSVCFVGGLSADSIREDVWSFDYYSKTWQQMSDFPVKQYGGVAVVIDNTAYVGLGRDENNVCNNSIWATTDGALTWELQTSYTVTGNVLGAVVCNRRLYIIDESYSLIEYNPETDLWTKKSALPAGHNREVHCIYAINNKIYIGLDSYSFVVYDPVWDN